MMKKEKVKVYIYTRVSTAMQIDGYSLEDVYKRQDGHRHRRAGMRQSGVFQKGSVKGKVLADDWPRHPAMQRAGLRGPD